MANPFLLFASQVQGMSKTERETFVHCTKPDTSDAKGVITFTNAPDEVALRSGITSMEHWLDLNA